MLSDAGSGPGRGRLAPVAVGVEEEFHIVGRGTRRLAARAGSVLEQLPAGRFAAELQRSVVEANSRPHVRYPGGDMPVFQINFSRPAGQIIASYYNFLRLGHEGYRRIHQASYDIGQYLAAEIVKMGPFGLLCDSNPNTGIPTVTWRIRDGADPG